MTTVNYTEAEKQHASNVHGFRVNEKLEKRLREEARNATDPKVKASWLTEAEDAERIKKNYEKSAVRTRPQDPVSNRRALDLADSYKTNLDADVDDLFEDAEANVKSKNPDAFKTRGTSIIIGSSSGSSPSTRYEDPTDDGRGNRNRSGGSRDESRGGTGGDSDRRDPKKSDGSCAGRRRRSRFDPCSSLSDISLTLGIQEYAQDVLGMLSPERSAGTSPLLTKQNSPRFF